MAIQGYKITEGQKNAIAVPQKYSGIYFNPVQDKFGNWYIFEEEKKVAIDAGFGWAPSLVASEYIPPDPEPLEDASIDDGTNPKKQ